LRTAVIFLRRRSLLRRTNCSRTFCSDLPRHPPDLHHLACSLPRPLLSWLGLSVGWTLRAPRPGAAAEIDGLTYLDTAFLQAISIGYNRSPTYSRLSGPGAIWSGQGDAP
jgi:hypothetical protein